MTTSPGASPEQSEAAPPPSIAIEAVVIHKLVKSRHGKAAVVKRKELLPLTDSVKKLVSDIHESYSGRTGKGFGRFDADELSYPTAGVLREAYKTKTKSFLEATHVLMDVLASKASQAPLATGGYVIMAQFSNHSGVRWFITAIINNSKGSAINDASLDIVDSEHVDMHNLRVVGRVNIREWLNENSDVRYIGFLKQKGDVSDYFKLFLGCNELIASVDETKKLVAVLKGFAKNAGLDQDKQEVFLKSAYDYCIARKKNNEPLILEAMTNAIWPEEPKTLQKALTEGDVEIADGFVPDGRILSTFVKIKAKTQFWTVELERQALVSGQAKFDSDKKTLTLSDLPLELIHELNFELGNG
jgi:nucleoid-associated protein